MSTYGFRLRFFLPKGSVISHDSDTLEIQLNSEISSPVIRLVSTNNVILKESNDLSIRGNGFSSEHEAYTVGIRVKNSLIFSATLLQMGIDCGKDKTTSMIAKFIKDQEKEQGRLLLDSVHGLSVYPEDMPVRFFSANASLTTGVTSTKFTEELKKAYALSLDYPDKLSLSFELYGASHFETSPRAKFLSLITAVECLCVQDRNSKAVLEHVDNLINLTEVNFTGPEKENIISRLGQLKRESISSACKKIVTDNLEKEDILQFEDLYNVRSRMLHDGRTPEGVDLGTEVLKLDKIVSKLLTKIAS